MDVAAEKGTIHKSVSSLGLRWNPTAPRPRRPAQTSPSLTHTLTTAGQDPLEIDWAIWLTLVGAPFYGPMSLTTKNQQEMIALY